MVEYEITEEGFKVWPTPINALMKLKSYREQFYNRLVEKGAFTLSSAFDFPGNLPSIMVNS